MCNVHSIIWLQRVPETTISSGCNEYPISSYLTRVSKGDSRCKTSFAKRGYMYCHLFWEIFYLSSFWYFKILEYISDTPNRYNIEWYCWSSKHLICITIICFPLSRLLSGDTPFSCFTYLSSNVWCWGKKSNLHHLLNFTLN